MHVCVIFFLQHSRATSHKYKPSRCWRVFINAICSINSVLSIKNIFRLYLNAGYTFLFLFQPFFHIFKKNRTYLWSDPEGFGLLEFCSCNHLIRHLFLRELSEQTATIQIIYRTISATVYCISIEKYRTNQLTNLTINNHRLIMWKIDCKHLLSICLILTSWVIDRTASDTKQIVPYLKITTILKL